MIEMVLKKEGFTNIHKAHTAADAMALVRHTPFDIIVLDVMLPDGNGFDLCPKIRELSQAYILFLTARVSDLDILTGFATGGDDYVTKPFNPLEIAARIKAHLRRNAAKHKAAAPESPEYRFGRFTLNEESGELRVGGKTVPCPTQVYLLLLYFCKNPNKILSKQALLDAVWGIDHFGDDNTVSVHIRRIRERIEQDPGNPEYLVTVRGLGYKLIQEAE